MRAADRHAPDGPRGQHFLPVPLAAIVVRNAGVTSGDLVVDIGAGAGVLTAVLAERAGRVIAIERDPRLVRRLRRRFEAVDNVCVVEGDARTTPLPGEPFRVVANLPFAITTVLLHRLLDEPSGPFLRGDVVVQWSAAVKRASPVPSSVLTLSWAPWFEFTVTRRIPRRDFRPPPPVDAGVLQVVRRPDPLLPPGQRERFVAFVREGFRSPAAGGPPSRDDVGAWVERFRARM